MFKGITKKIIAVTVALVCIAVASPIDAWAVTSAYFDATGNETSWDKEVYRGQLYRADESERELSYDFNWAMIMEYRGGETDILTIPETLRCSGDYTVKYIYNGVFQGCTAKKIIIPGTVDIIEGFAFQDCVNLEEINIPDGVVIIEQGTFAGCQMLNNITLPSSLGMIRESAFDGCQSLTSITIPSNVSVVYNNAFANCSSLESVVIEDASKFTSFSNSAFESCPSINAIEIKTATDVSQIENILTIVSADSTTPTRTIKVPSQYVKEIKQDASFSQYNVCDLEGNPALASVSFQANGHGTAPANANIALGNKIVAPTAPTAEGYTFAGWYKEAACTNAWNFATDTVMDDVTLYAKWIRHEPDPTEVVKAQVTNFVTRMYTVALSRNPDDGGLKDWTNGLLTGQMDGASIARGFIFSKEFTEKNLSNEEFVDTLYSTLLGRQPDPDGKADWLKALNEGQARTKVLAGFVNSNEFGALCESYGIARGTMEEDGSNIYNENVRKFVLRNYTNTLKRNGEVAGVEYWCYQINKGRIEPVEVARCFFYSEEFKNKNKNLSDEDYVEMLYESFLGRHSDANGKAYWVNALKSGKSRDEVLDGFAYSSEFGKIIKSLGL